MGLCQSCTGCCCQENGTARAKEQGGANQLPANQPEISVSGADLAARLRLASTVQHHPAFASAVAQAAQSGSGGPLRRWSRGAGPVDYIHVPNESCLAQFIIPEALRDPSRPVQELRIALPRDPQSIQEAAAQVSPILVKVKELYTSHDAASRASFVGRPVIGVSLEGLDVLQVQASAELVLAYIKPSGFDEACVWVAEHKAQIEGQTFLVDSLVVEDEDGRTVKLTLEGVTRQASRLPALLGGTSTSISPCSRGRV